VHDNQGALRHRGGATERGGDRRSESPSRLAGASDQFACVALELARSGSAVQRRLECGARLSPVERSAVGHSAVVCPGGGTNRGPDAVADDRSAGADVERVASAERLVRNGGGVERLVRGATESHHRVSDGRAVFESHQSHGDHGNARGVGGGRTVARHRLATLAEAHPETAAFITHTVHPPNQGGSLTTCLCRWPMARGKVFFIFHQNPYAKDGYEKRDDVIESGPQSPQQMRFSRLAAPARRAAHGSQHPLPGTHRRPMRSESY